MGSLSALVANLAVLLMAAADVTWGGTKAEAERTAKERATNTLEVKNFILIFKVLLKGFEDCQVMACTRGVNLAVLASSNANKNRSRQPNVHCNKSEKTLRRCADNRIDKILARLSQS